MTMTNTELLLVHTPTLDITLTAPGPIGLSIKITRKRDGSSIETTLSPADVRALRQWLSTGMVIA